MEKKDPKQLEIDPSIEHQLLGIVRHFISEFKSERATHSVQLASSLDRDLGIDSLGRVELFLRIEKNFGIQFPDSLMAEADTVQDILYAVQHAVPVQKIIHKEFTNTLDTTTTDPLSAKTLVDLLIRRATREPNRPHVYLQDEFGEEKIIRFGELLELATHVAGGLHALGLKQGETVAIMLPTSADFFFAFYGVLLAGGIPVPIYPPIRADKIEEYAIREAGILNNAEVRILITFDKVEMLSKLLRVFIKSLKSVTAVPLLLQTKTPPPRFSIRPEDPGLIQYTSGSTSDPKGVLLSHHNLLSNIRSFGKAIELKPTDVGVSWLPLYHDMGLIGAWLGSVYHAFPLTLLSPIAFINRPERWLWAIHYHRATLSAGPNFAYELCVRKIDPAQIEGLDLSSWRLAFNGAEAVNPRTLERFAKKFGPYGLKAEALYPVYGLAESTVALTFPPLNRGLKTDRIQRAPFETEKKAIPAETSDVDTLEFVACGKPIPDHDIRIVDENNQEVSERTVGSLQFMGPSTMQGYYNNLEATKAVYFEGWVDSGDYAYIADKEIYITGRKKDVIIKAGRNLYPQEIEEATAQVTGIRKGCVIAFGTFDPKWSTEKLVIVAETEVSNAKEQQKISHEVTEKVSIVLGIPPDEVILVPLRTIPKTSSGKLQRSLCKKMYLDGILVRKGLPIWAQMAKLFLKGLGISIIRKTKIIARFFYSLYVGLLILFFVPFLWLAVVLLPTFSAEKMSKQLVRIFLKLLFCPIKITNQESLTAFSPMIFVSNHASYLDSLLLLSILPMGTAIVGKKELNTWPIMKTIMKKFNFPTVDRLDFSKSLSDIDNIVKLLQQKRSLLIFPEGTFGSAPGLRPFKLGAFKISADTKTPLCPIALQGTRNIFRGDSLLFNPGNIQITLAHPLVPKHSDWDEVIRLHTEARKEISAHCGELSIDLIAASVVKNEKPDA